MSPLVRGCYGIFHILNCNYSYISTRHVKNKLYKGNCFTVPALLKSTTQKQNVDIKKDKTTDNATFEKMIESRREEASRSILVQVHSEQSCDDLHKYCSQYGEVHSMHHYSLPGSLNFVLVEFKHKTDVDHIMDISIHINKKEVIPVHSPFLWFRAPKTAQTKRKSVPPTGQTMVANGNSIPTQTELKDCMQASESLSDQMMFLHQMTCLSDLGSRLRFLTARQIELAVNGLFPKVTVLPFGSSVNSFGKAGCDLDLVLVTDKDEIEDESKNCRLVFQAKTSLANGRSQVQRHMEMLGDVCQLLLPGCSQVRRILQARVPIIKYHQDLTGIECDLSMTNMSAVYMSELLYIMGASDWRVRPLVFAVRTWAREVGLTNPTPGRWITNFSLTLLVLFYLQQHTSSQAPVLPTLNALISFAGPDDRRVTSDGVNCTFIRNISQLQKHMASTKKSPNKESLESLFIGFFEFYSSFDFSSHAVSLVYGNSIPKPEHSPLYIANPLERGFNVSKNVSHDETERLRIEFRNAAWILESVPLRSDKLKKSSELWGLTALFESPRLAEKGRNIFYIPSASRRNTSRIVDVSVLFQDDESESANKANLTLNSESNKENVVPGPPKHVKVEKSSGRVRRR